MILHVDLDAFFASIEQRDNPELLGKPVIVGGVNPGGKRVNRGVVATASYEARVFGVYSGMPISQVQRVCPQAVFVAGSFEKYRKASCKMYEILESFCDRVEHIGIDEAFLDLYGFKDYYPDFLSLGKKIKEKIRQEIGISASVGIAKNKLVAKIACSFKKPNGLTLIPKGEERKFLAPLPIENLYGVGQRLRYQLNNLGVKTIGDLAHYPLKRLELYFGQYGRLLWSFAHGEDSRKVILSFPVKSIGRSTTFPHDLKEETYIRSILRYLTEKVAWEVRKHGLTPHCVTLTIRYWNFKTLTHQRALDYPRAQASDIFNEVCQLLDEAWNREYPLRLVGVRVSQFDEGIRQLSFEELGAGKIQQFEKSADILRRKYGFWVIYPASLLRVLPNYPLT